ISGSRETYLHRAAVKGDLALTEMLLQSGADIEILNDEKMNALELALNQPATAKMLIEHGAKINIEESKNKLAKIGRAVQPTLMKLFVAQTKKNKKYEFIASVIDQAELNDFLLQMELTEKLLNQKVLIRTTAGFTPHWYCAVIKIDKGE